jgi:hypothetical protein
MWTVMLTKVLSALRRLISMIQEMMDTANWTSVHRRETKFTWGKENSGGIISVVQRKGAGCSITEGTIHITKKVVGTEMMKDDE